MFSNVSLSLSAALAAVIKTKNSKTNGLYKYKEKLADMAIYVEREMCKEAGGIQDQVAASFGNFNQINFGKEYKNKFNVQNLPLSYDDKIKFNDNLMMFFTGISRNSFEIQNKTQGQLGSNTGRLIEMNKLVDEAYDYLMNKEFDEFGKLLDYTWRLKRGLNSSISNDYIDEIYNVAKEVGALGGKLLGAGGGGFMLFYIKKEYQDKLRGRLKNLLEIPFKFDEEGTKIIYKSIL